MCPNGFSQNLTCTRGFIFGDKMQITIDKNFEKLIPPLTPDEFSGLESDIVKRGKCLDSIKVWQPDKSKDEHLICDGHNRYKICQKHKISDYRVTVLDLKDRNEVEAWILLNQLNRRNLNDFQRTELALQLKDTLAKKAEQHRDSFAKFSKTEAPINTRKEIAKKADVAEEQVRRVEKILDEAPKKTINAVRKGDISINKAYKEIRPSLQKPQSSKRAMTSRDTVIFGYGNSDLNGNFGRGAKLYFVYPNENSQEGIDFDWIASKLEGVKDEMEERYMVRKK